MTTLSLLVVLLAVFSTTFASKSSLLWLCLERCPGFDFNADLKMLAAHKNQLQYVSYENWQIDANGHLQFATHNGVPVSDVGARIAGAGYPLFPMLTSGTFFFGCCCCSPPSFTFFLFFLFSFCYLF